MNPILLQPTDVLFFRDGRPMSGSLSGHGAAWPLPSVVSHALHAALHRASLDGVHSHRRGRSGAYSNDPAHRDRKFGSLCTAGPFPVLTQQETPTWFFPRPADVTSATGIIPTLHPTRPEKRSSLPPPLDCIATSSMPPSKDKLPPWWSEATWNAYLGSEQRQPGCTTHEFRHDADFSDTHTTYGIGIDPDTDSVIDKMFYSASYLRLRANCRLGVLASAPDKDYRTASGNNDLVSILLDPEGGHILVGGQQRVCTTTRDASVNGRLPLPLGLSSGFASGKNGTCLVKWILLSPAIWPAITGDDTNRIKAHPGGWLPNWIDPETGAVLLKSGDQQRQPGEGRLEWRQRVRKLNPVAARLTAAIVAKPITVTGWSLPNSANDPEHAEGGAKSTHLAVPAGSVYYFECQSPEDASALAHTLNWHGHTHGSAIVNRRSALMGEKGYGIGVCGSWQPSHL